MKNDATIIRARAFSVIGKDRELARQFQRLFYVPVTCRGHV